MERPRLRDLPCEQVHNGRRAGVQLTDPLDLAPGVFVPGPLLPIVARMDGSRTCAQIAAAAAADLREPVTAAFVQRLAEQFDAHGLLDSPRHREAVARAWQQLGDRGVRPCRHAGSAGYPEAPDRLRAALLHQLDAVVEPAPPGHVRGLIAPHLDLERGRDGYLAAYRHLLAAPPADLHVIFGTGHNGPSAPITGWPLDWQTPLGTATTDRAFVDRVHGAIGAAGTEDLLRHCGEHSLEFQVLWLQLLQQRRGTGCRVAAFLCGALPSAGGDPTGEDYVRRIVAAVRDAAAASGGSVCYIAGADLAHIGPLFGDDDPVDDARAAQLAADERARLRHLQDGAPGAFHRAVMQDGNPDRVCSATAITLTALLAGGPMRLLHYGQTRAADGSQLVGYAAASFADQA